MSGTADVSPRSRRLRDCLSMDCRALDPPDLRHHARPHLRHFACEEVHMVGSLEVDKSNF